MSVKKNLTVATVMALLAVPAFSATNASHALHIPSITAHADSGYYGAVHTNNLIHGITINGHYWPAGTPIYGSHDGSRIGKNGYITGYFGAPGNDGGKNDYIVSKSYVDNVNNDSGSADNWTNHVGSSIGRTLMNKVKSLGGTYNNNTDTENLYYNGHHFELTGTASGVLIDGKSATDAQALAMLDGTSSDNNSASTNTNNSNKSNTSSSNNPSNSTNETNGNYSSDNGSANDSSANSTSTNGSQSSEYQNGNTNNGKLVQTGENDGASKAMALGASALVASAGLMAFSFARKHKYLESVDLTFNTDTVSASNGKGSHDDTPKYSNKSSYDMIMGDTFANLSKSLKNL